VLDWERIEKFSESSSMPLRSPVRTPRGRDILRLRPAQGATEKALRARALALPRDGDDGFEMDSLGRLLLRFVLVRSVSVVAVVVATL